MEEEKEQEEEVEGEKEKDDASVLGLWGEFLCSALVRVGWWFSCISVPKMFFLSSKGLGY